MPLKGPQLAYYLKKRNPELYQRAREVKERYNVTWDEAFAILRGEKKPPTQTPATGGELQISDVVKRLELLEKRVEELSEATYFLELGLSRRFRFEDCRCVYMDGDGCCTAFYLMEPVKGFRLREVVEKGVKMYYINIKTHEWVCALCPRYTPKYLAETLNNLRSKTEFLELRLKSLESQVEKLRQIVSEKSVISELESIRKSIEELRKELKF